MCMQPAGLQGPRWSCLRRSERRPRLTCLQPILPAACHNERLQADPTGIPPQWAAGVQPPGGRPKLLCACSATDIGGGANPRA